MSKRIRDRQMVVMLSVALSLAGCFRPAGETIEPTASGDAQTMPVEPSLDMPAAPTQEVSDPAVTVEAAAPDLMNAATEPVEDAGSAAPTTPVLSASATFPPITVISPTRALPTQAPTGASLTGATPVQTTPAAAGTTFVTPGIPLGQVTRVAPTFTPAGGAFTATPSGIVTPTALFGAAADGCTYAVQPGDNLYRIAIANDTTLEQMRLVNPDLVGSDPILQPGQVLALPDCAPSADGGSAVQPAGTPVAPVAGDDDGIIGAQQTYTVQPGDTLLRISREFGVTIDAIVQANALTNPDRLDVGQQLIIPPRTED